MQKNHEAKFWMDRLHFLAIMMIIFPNSNLVDALINMGCCTTL